MTAKAMKDRKVTQSPAIAISPQKAQSHRHAELMSAERVSEAHVTQDLSAIALLSTSNDGPPADDPAIRPRTGSAGLKALLKFRHSKKAVAADRPSVSPQGPTPQSTPPDDRTAGSKGFKGLLDSFRPRSKSDAASLKSAMLQRRRHQSGQSVVTVPTPAAEPAAASAEGDQAMRPRATSWGARDKVLIKKDLAASAGGAAVNGSGAATTAMSQLLGGSPRKMTPVEKNHHHLGASFSSHGDHNFSGKALLYRHSPSVDTGAEIFSPNHRRAHAMAAVAGKRAAFKDAQWHSTDCCELEGMEIEDLEEEDPMVFVKFMKAHKCYNLIPTSAKLVIFDTMLSVKKAFFALVYNNVRAALLWDSAQQDYIGMLTISDFILILEKYYKSPNVKMEELEEHQISSWRKALQDHYKPQIVSISPDASVNDAVRMLLDHKVHRLPVIDPVSGNALYIMTHKRILKFLYLFMKNLPAPVYMSQTLSELKIGTYSDVAKVAPDTTLIEALNIFVARRVSALPVVAKDGRVVDIYAKFDVINLAADKSYNNLDVPISLALNYRKTGQDIVHKCKLKDTLAAVVEKIVRAGVHRLIVCGDHDELVGILSLSDILSRLTLDTAAVKCRVLHAAAEDTAASRNGAHVVGGTNGVI